MQQKLVSMVVPTYNQSEYLGACLDSIWFQDYPNLEIVVVNDCSTDGTRELLDEFQRNVAEEQVSYASCFNEQTNEIERVWHPRYPAQGRRLVVLHNEQNMGSTRTYNRGFQAATGDYCTYIASDDICHPQMISSLAAPLDQDKADFVYSDTFIVDDAGRIMREFKLPDYSFKNCFLDWYLCGVSKLYRRSLHEKYGWYDNDFLANDHEFYQRLALGGERFTHIAKTLYSIRSHDQHRGRQKDVHSSASWLRLLDESRSLVKQARLAWAKGEVSDGGQS